MTVARWLPESRRDGWRAFASRSRQVVVWSAVTGAVTGVFVAGFERLVVTDAFGHILGLSPWIIAVLPGLGLLVALAARRFVGRGVSSATADDYLQAFHDPGHTLGLRAFVARTLAGLATLGSGGPMGLEGPSLYAGAVVGSNLQRRLPRRFRDADRRVLLVAGAAAGVAAIFKAPATGTVFALEVPYQDDLARNMLLPAMVSSAAGYLVFAGINGTTPLFPIQGTVDLTMRDLLGAALLGVVAGLGARGFAWLLRSAKSLSTGPHPVLLALAAGATRGGAVRHRTHRDRRVARRGSGLRGDRLGLAARTIALDPRDRPRLALPRDVGDRRRRRCGGPVHPARRGRSAGRRDDRRRGQPRGPRSCSSWSGWRRSSVPATASRSRP